MRMMVIAMLVGALEQSLISLKKGVKNRNSEGE